MTQTTKTTISKERIEAIVASDLEDIIFMLEMESTAVTDICNMGLNEIQRVLRIEDGQQVNKQNLEMFKEVIEAMVDEWINS